MDVYINDIAKFLPNKPVYNDTIEQVLGKINGNGSKTKRIVLRNNKIECRYYAIDPESGELTHTNAQLAAEAVRRLDPYDGFQISDIDCLACGTTCQDLLFPGHALMVAGELGASECEAVTTAGICLSGMTAMKYAYLTVAAGQSANAVSTGSELASSFMRAGFFMPISRPDADDLEKEPVLAFDADFLRWMLSDGAGAVYLSNRPNSNRLSLRIDWIESMTFAGELETCMYAGGYKNGNGSVVGWRSLESIPEEHRQYLLAVRQDIRLLDKNIVQTAMHRTLKNCVEKHNLKPEDIDWFLPHYSSAYFRPRFYEGMQDIGFEIPYDKWFTNLSTTGNSGSAAIYIIMEELLKSQKLQAGQNLLCFIPESGRFTHCFMKLTVV